MSDAVTQARPATASGVTYDFTGSVVLVTGAARGMGRDLVQRFAGAGASVMASDVAPEPVPGLDYATATADDLSATVESARGLGGGEVDVRRCDVRSEEE
ncbi:MAG: SDR family NAD(P)-dependent oxidoreductase, partial [Actinobacteria bacterium]|nr:SDR family NAD(P)-dependent oxidoreductase [Actinomycetota bacterium]